ncbi:MAG: asparaginase [Proteobacteria bacterium]|nr:asparaginase [Pseudomonadota bacterium]
MTQILVLTTGGTIDKLYFDALSQYQVGETVVGRVLATARVTHPPRIVELMRKDSLELTGEDRTIIAQAVAEAPESHIVITHGTDTMADTARALATAIPEVLESKTVVLVGALAPARFAESDAPFNLGMAFGAAQSARPGVWITMNGQVFDGRHVRKDRAIGAFVGN